LSTGNVVIFSIIHPSVGIKYCKYKVKKSKASLKLRVLST